MFAYDKNLYICNHFAYVECELVYSLFLRARNRLQGRQPLTEEMVEKILEIEQEAFPERFLMEESFQNLQELAEYAHCSSLSPAESSMATETFGRSAGKTGRKRQGSSVRNAFCSTKA